MDVFGIVYIIDTPQQFWSELEDILHLTEDANLEQLDATLARFIHFCASYHEQYLQTPVQLEHACHLLLQSELFAFHSERMREHLLKEAESTTDPHAQLVLYEVLLLYGRSHPSFLRSQKKWAPLIPPMMDHVLLDFDPEVEDSYTSGGGGWTPKSSAMVPIEARLRLLSVGILYEVCRVQKFSMTDLRIFDDTLIDHLFELVEQTRHMQDETLNYSVIKLIVALNEQFMVASLQASSPSATATHHHHHHASKHSPPEESNRVLRILMRRLNSSKTFGENMIFMLNRAERSPEDLCMQLLVLKILYLLFTTKGTSEYFYTNDLCVLVDVFLRELVDLDEESESLRHTYLRVLHPLLTRTQLRTIPYKRPQIVHTLESLISNSRIRDINPTTKRLVERCLSGEWCVQLRRPSISDTPTSPSSGDSTPIGSTSRVASPGVDSDVASTSRSVYITSSPEDDRSGGLGLKRNKSLKSSRSAEHLRQNLSSAAGGKTKSPHPHGGHGEGSGIHGKLKNNSSINLVEVRTSLPSVSVSVVSPTPPNGGGGAGLGKKSRSHTIPPSTQQTGVGVSSLPASMEDLSNAPASCYHNSFGQALESIVAPTPLSAPSSLQLTVNAPNGASGSVKKHHRSAPPTPPKRRKPPAIPTQTAGGVTITTIASSSSSSRSTPSPLSRVPPVMPS